MNGAKVSKEQFDKQTERRVRLHGGINTIVGSNRAPGGHEPYWGTGHESFGLGVPPHQSQEYQEYLEKQGFTGFTITGEGSLITHSPENKRKIMEHFNLAEQTPYGTGKKKTESTQKPPEATPPDPEILAKETKRIRQLPQIKHMLGDR